MRIRAPEISWRQQAVGLSILLHLIFFASAGFFYSLSSREIEQPASLEPDKPLVFEFEKKPVVESPESARDHLQEEEADFLSDKSARAQNQQAPEQLPEAAPFSDGLIPVPEIAELPRAAAETEAKRAQVEETYGEELAHPDADPASFSREFLLRAKDATQRPYTGNAELERLKSKNQDSRTPDVGTFSLNTYEWDFAPYMIRLKRRIEKHIFPPPAFTRLGMINGQFLIRFRISLEGDLDAVEVLSANGHESLLTTSTQAVKASAPFEPLPENFPKKFLEVTGQFNYFIVR